jgi:superoxide dismutase, Cu-Zn family
MKPKMTLVTNAVLSGAVLILTTTTGCRTRDTQAARKPVPELPSRAIAQLTPASGSGTRGAVYFSQENEGVRVSGVIIGLSPGDHGIHIHETGDCSAPDASSAGAHFNPTGAPHGGPASNVRHVGDFGNITADSAGTARFSKTIPSLNVQGANSILGKALVVHEKADDLTSQPAGNSGARVACGVIRLE